LLERIWQPYTQVVPPVPDFLPDIEGFQWDDGNSSKSWTRHRVTRTEAEQVFLNRPIVVAGDPTHSGTEARYFAFGRTDAGRWLAVVFTVRGPLVRVIPARPMSRRERREHGKATGT
jgi:uncharacterized protein